MHDLVVVRDTDCRKQLLDQVDRDVDAESPVLIEPRTHGATLDPLHNNEKDWAVFVEVIDADDPWMVEGGDCRGLAVKALAETEVTRVLLGQDLDGDRYLESGMR